MVLNNIGSAWLQELRSDNAAVRKSAKVGRWQVWDSPHGTNCQSMGFIATRCCVTKDLEGLKA